MGFRDSRGRVSMMPMMVSAGPTMTLSLSSALWSVSRESLSVLWAAHNCSFTRLTLRGSGGTVTMLCFGIGGATDWGTSKSHMVTFSLLQWWVVVADASRLHMLDVAIALELRPEECGGFSIRLTTELLTFTSILGDDLRGGSGGAISSTWLLCRSVRSAERALFNTLLKGGHAAFGEPDVGALIRFDGTAAELPIVVADDELGRGVVRQLDVDA